MHAFNSADRDLASGLNEIDYTNPFLPRRVEIERRILGPAHVDQGDARSRRPDQPPEDPNSTALLELSEALLARSGKRLEARGEPGTEDLALYEGVAVFTLYHRWRDRLSDLAVEAEAPNQTEVEVPRFEDFETEALAALRPGQRRLPMDLSPAHLLSVFFQVARAFHQIHSNILGTSDAAVRLRAAVWQSIFTHDIRRYQRSLYRCMRDLATLVTGPSGTGKELVARAVALSSYIAFDPKRCAFPTDPAQRFLPLNLTALSPTLIESELFGHQRGAFTGALADRRGWFELCPPQGAVFLDEIGDVSLEIQVKLLRVLQTRNFQRLGDSRSRVFRGKVISATNRDLEQRIGQRSFREDLYYRICSDRIQTPSLAEQVNGSMEELGTLALFVARDLIGEEAQSLADEVVEWVESELGVDYPWPGNFRELEQCVRSVLVRKEYRPRRAGQAAQDAGGRLARGFLAGERTADRVLRDYCTLVYSRTKSYQGAAQRLGLDRRTVRAKVDLDLLERLARDSDPAPPAAD